MTTQPTATVPRRARLRAALTLLLLGTVVVHATMFLSKPVVSYRVLALGGDENAVGLVAAAAALLPIFLAIPMGRLSDRGRTPVLLFGGAVVLVAGPFGLANTGSLAGMAAVNAVYGFGLLALMVAGQAVVIGLSAPGEHDRNFGWFTAAASFGQMLGPLIGGWALASEPSLLDGTSRAFTTAGLIATGVLILFTAMMVVLRATTALAPSSSKEEGGAGRGSALGMLRDRQLSVAVFVSFAFIAAVDLLIAYLPVLGDHHGLSPAFVGTLLAIRAGFSFLSRMLIGVLMKLAGRLLVIAASSVIAAVTALALVATSDQVVLVGLMMVLGLTLGLGQPLTMTWVVAQAPQRLRATALALRITGNRIAQSAGPAAAGGLSTVVGVAGPFALVTVLLCAAAASVVPFMRAG